MEVQIRDARLGNRHQLLTIGFFVEEAGDEFIDDLAFDLLGEAVADDGGRNFAPAEAGQAGHLGEILDDFFGLAGDDVGWDLDLDLSTGSAASFGWAHGHA